MEMAKEGNVHIKNMQSKKLKMIHHTAEAFHKYSNAIPFVIVNIFISSFGLITHYFTVTVTDYSYIYFVI